MPVGNQALTIKKLHVVGISTFECLNSIPVLRQVLRQWKPL